MFNSKNYWETRYKAKGTSGAGSYGLLCDYKANIINNFIKQNSINSVIEFGCGDGNQLSKFICNNYVGYDVSETVINNCREKFKNDSSKKFYLNDEYHGEQYDLALSLDVIYHLVEDEIFEDYMNKLFNSSKQHVIIYSSNGDVLKTSADHLYDRNFTNWIDENKKEFILTEKIINAYKYDEKIKDSVNTSISDFYIYNNIAR